MSANPTSGAIPASNPELAQAVAKAVNAEGYAIVTGVLDRKACDTLVAEVDRVETEHQVEFGKNDFEGFQTRRIFNLIQRSGRFRELVLDEAVLGIIDAILGEDFLLSGTTSMHISPGETPQLLHADDGMITLPRPHVATLVTTLWALTDFEADNGATRLVPGSHLNPDIPRPGETHADIAAEMPAGSVLVLHGSTWHGGGTNSTRDRERYGLSIQFVAGWCRQQQNLMLGTDPGVVASYPRRLQELIGYSLYRNLMGHVDREHPLTLLGQDVRPEMLWDKMGNQPKK
ncbi:MAG: phytanoyl-CoA dioxygenase family protein [Myxococcales bacterium]|nr:phytanoyl-CoA dioxygenase family protein [Myxococcales bacterium]